MTTKQDDTMIAQCGRSFNSKEIEQIKETVELFPQLSRKELAETICEHLEWFTAAGTNKIDACSKLLEKLEDDGSIRLPEKKTIVPKPWNNKIDFTSPYVPFPVTITLLIKLQGKTASIIEPYP